MRPESIHLLSCSKGATTRYAYAGKEGRPRHSCNLFATQNYDKSGQHHTLDNLAPAHTWYPLYRRLGGHQGRPGQHGKSHHAKIQSPDHPAHNQSLFYGVMTAP